MGLLSPFKRARRKRILRDAPIPDDVWEWAIKEHRIFRWLDSGDRNRLRELSTIFLGEKTFDPVGGVDLDVETKVSIAAQACLPLLGLDMDWYDDWSTIIVTPREYGVEKRDLDEAGVVHEYDDEFAGEAFDLGPVALSKVDVEASGWGDGYNVVIHEMAHKLDGRNGAFDGCPPLRVGMTGGAWKAAFKTAFEDFRVKIDRPPSRRSRRKSPRIDSYAAESPDEFFAVCCEYFFEKPHVLKSEYPEVYDQLSSFFGRDPTKPVAESQSPNESH
jgi:MtfA peptidase